MSHQFIDSRGTRGGQHDSTNRTIAVRNKQKIKFHYLSDKRKFKLDIPDFKSIVITKRNAVKLAEWILSLERREC